MRLKDSSNRLIVDRNLLIDGNINLRKIGIKTVKEEAAESCKSGSLSSKDAQSIKH
jgi:hypothetical protein